MIKYLGSIGILPFVTAAHAGVVVQLSDRFSPDPTQSSGVYQPGDLALIDVRLVQESGGALRLLRVIQLDFEQSHPWIEFVSPDCEEEGCPPGPGPWFWFDVANLPQGGGFYGIYPELPRPGMAFTGTAPNGLRQFNLRADGTPIELGYVLVDLPFAPGVYTLDAVTPADPADSNLGGLVSYGFGVVPGDDIVELRPGSGMSGGQYTFVVVPEPAATLAVAVGLLGMIGRARSARAARG